MFFKTFQPSISAVSRRPAWAPQLKNTRVLQVFRLWVVKWDVSYIWDTREMGSHNSSLPFLDRRWSQPPSWLSCPMRMSSYSPSPLILSQNLITLIIELPRALVLPPHGLSGEGSVVGHHDGQYRSEDMFRTSQCSDAMWPRGPKWNSNIVCGNSEWLR